MSYLPALLALAGVTLVAAVSPGPDFVVTVHYSTHSQREGTFVALGVISALLVWIIGSIAGLEILFAQVSWLAEIIRILGAFYLIYLGIKTIHHARLPVPPSSTSLVITSSFSAWRVGFLSDIGNPKVLAFFSSVFLVVFPAHPPLWVQLVSIILMLIINIGWYGLVVYLFSLGPVAHLYRRTKRWIDYITGGIFVVLGIRLAFFV